jgi:hypothetical protein
MLFFLSLPLLFPLPLSHLCLARASRRAHGWRHSAGRAVRLLARASWRRGSGPARAGGGRRAGRAGAAGAAGSARWWAAAAARCAGVAGCGGERLQAMRSGASASGSRSSGARSAELGPDAGDGGRRQAGAEAAGQQAGAAAGAGRG